VVFVQVVASRSLNPRRESPREKLYPGSRTPRRRSPE